MADQRFSGDTKNGGPWTKTLSVQKVIRREMQGEFFCIYITIAQ
jgi:hypothetical protein